MQIIAQIQVLFLFSNETRSHLSSYPDASLNRVEYQVVHLSVLHFCLIVLSMMMMMIILLKVNLIDQHVTVL